MNTKLTLSLDKDVIEQAKQEAASRGISLSRLVEQLLERTVTKMQDKKARKVKIPTEVKKLRGIISLPADFDPKKDRTDHLAGKYGL